MAQLSTIEWTGKSNTKYSFQVHSIDDEIPTHGGVYIFSKRTDDAKHAPIYIGMAKSFEKRFYNHHKDDCIDKKGANRLCLLQVDNETQRIKIEEDLLANYNTSCNEVNN